MASFKCSVCPRKFTDEDCYKCHMDVHATGFSCSKCNRPFAKKFNLNAHIRNNSCPKSIVKRTYKCDGHCDKVFASSRTLGQHMRVVKGTFKCQNCPKTFERKARLDIHQTKCRDPLPSVSSDDDQFQGDFLTSPSHPRATHPPTPNVPKALCKLQCTSDSSDNSELDESNHSNVSLTDSASNDSTSTSPSPTPVRTASSPRLVPKSCKKSLVYPAEPASNAEKSTRSPRRSTRDRGRDAKLRALCLSPIRCDNQGILYKFHDPKKNFGVKSHTDIDAGSYVLSYHGERFTRAAGLDKEEELQAKGEIASYLMFFQDKAINADPHNDGSFGGLLNHSRTAPNLGWSTRYIEGTWYVAFFALKQIPADTELLWDYGEDREEIIAANPWLKE